jgi:cobalt-precorrin-5B (C1)-methyltransferase
MSVPAKTPPRSGFTLPVFACAAAIAALKHLQQQPTTGKISLDLIEPPQTVEIPLESVALLDHNCALAITRSDPGDNLDLTRNTPIWAVVSLTPEKSVALTLEGGAGVGKQAGGEAAIYAYAHRLFQTNLLPLLGETEKITVRIILPEGKRLAQRTSNAAFGVTEGLSLLGTTGIAQPLSAPAQLEAYQEELREKALGFSSLVFCIGENGRDLAGKLGVNPEQIVKTANWLGPMLLEAAFLGVEKILLFGYHGKLLKLAGGIFHTHHQVADGRLEILAAYAAQIGIPLGILQEILRQDTAEAALKFLQQEDRGVWVETLYQALALGLERRAARYIYENGEKSVQVGCLMFARDRTVLVTSPQAAAILSLCLG